MLRLALGLTLLFVLPMALIRAHPADSYPLGDFLAQPPSCHAPCFLGVRPGSTTLAEAVELLQANTTIAHVWRDGRSLRWRWLAGMPESYGFRLRHDAVIDGLLLPDSTTLGEVRLALGEPKRITLTSNGFRSRSPRVAWILEYPDRDVHIFAEFQVCHTHQAALWQMRQDLTLGSGFLVGVGSPDYIGVMPTRPIELDVHRWAKQLRDLCRP
jgi:hypothetical protein